MNSALKNVSWGKVALSAIPFVVLIFAAVFANLYFQKVDAPKERKAWPEKSFVGHHNKRFPYVGPLPLGYVFPKNGKKVAFVGKELGGFVASRGWADIDPLIAQKWIDAGLSSALELNGTFQKIGNVDLWVDGIDPRAKTLVEIRPAPLLWMRSGMPCEEFKARQDAMLSVDDGGRFVANWSADWGLRDATIYLCVEKIDRVLKWKDKLDNRFKALKLWKEKLVIKHEMLHPFLGLAHPERIPCGIYCASPTFIEISKGVQDLIRDALRLHKESKGTLE